MNYQTLDHKKYLRSVGTLTEKDMETIKDWCVVADKSNKQRHVDALKLRSNMLDLARQIWTKDSKQYKAIFRQLVDEPVSNMALYAKIHRKWEKHREEEQRKAERREYQRDRRQRSQEAAAMLASRGLVEGHDFTLGNAISTLQRLEAEVQS